jgi:hypothetical protein
VIPTNRGPMTADQIIEHLVYVSYAHNRDLGLSPEAFKRARFENVDALEARYQAERAKAVAL